MSDKIPCLSESTDPAPTDASFTCSPSIAQISAAMAQAQGEIESASKDRTNPHFKATYATLASVWNACRKPLAKNGLAVFQPAVAEGKSVKVTTLLAHKSGEWIRSTLMLEARDATVQSVGSAITYGRRYGLSAMVGVAPDDDDDGNSAQASRRDERQRVDIHEVVAALKAAAGIGELRAQQAAVSAVDEEDRETAAAEYAGALLRITKTAPVASLGDIGAEWARLKTADLLTDQEHKMGQEAYRARLAETKADPKRGTAALGAKLGVKAEKGDTLNGPAERAPGEDG